MARGLDEDGDEPEVWLLNRSNDEDYDLQLSNVHKVALQEGSQLVERWVPVSAGAADHYWDCEVYQVAAAYMARVHMLPSREELAQFEAAAAEEHKRSRRAAEQHRQEGGGWGVQGLDRYL